MIEEEPKKKKIPSQNSVFHFLFEMSSFLLYDF